MTKYGTKIVGGKILLAPKSWSIHTCMYLVCVIDWRIQRRYSVLKLQGKKFNFDDEMTIKIIIFLF